MSVQMVVDNLGAVDWWRGAANPIIAVFVELDTAGNLVDTAVTTNGVLGSSPNRATLTQAGKQAIAQIANGQKNPTTTATV